MNIRRSHIGGLICSILLLIVVIGGYLYAQHMVDVSVQDVLADRESSATLELARGQNKGLIAIYKDTAFDRDRLAHAITPTQAPIDLIVAVESIGHQSSSTLALTSIDSLQTEGASAQAPTMVTLRVSVEGSWSSVMKALKLAEALPYATRISRLNLDTSVLGNSTAKRNWKLTFDLSAALSATAATSSRAAARQ